VGNAQATYIDLLIYLYVYDAHSLVSKLPVLHTCTL